MSLDITPERWGPHYSNIGVVFSLFLTVKAAPFSANWPSIIRIAIIKACAPPQCTVIFSARPFLRSTRTTFPRRSTKTRLAAMMMMMRSWNGWMIFGQQMEQQQQQKLIRLLLVREGGKLLCWNLKKIIITKIEAKRKKTNSTVFVAVFPLTLRRSCMNFSHRPGKGRRKTA